MLRVCHAPSNREVKGTSFLSQAVGQLREEGFAIELEILENMAHDEVLKRIAECDVFMDQLHHGWYGGVAVEAMALGKPVICYIRKENLIFLPDSMAKELPVVSSDPNLILETLKSFLAAPNSTLVELGKSSRRFVEDWHDPIKVANQILEHYDEVGRRHHSVVQYAKSRD
jgi:glycosyltransferase involved in cell wall biosynthesis